MKPDECPLASIVVVNYNYGRFLGEAIDSALNQTYPNKEVIVVDDGSTDNSRDVIASYGSRIKPVLKENAGECSAKNSGYEASTGEVICFLDSDDGLYPTAIEEAVELMRDPDVVKVNWQLLGVDASGKSLHRLTPGPQLVAGDLRDIVIKEGPGSYVCSPTSGNLWARRYLEQVMPIPVAEYSVASDSYIELFAPFVGRIEKIDRAQGYYRVHGSNISGKVPFAEQVRMFDHRSERLARYLRKNEIKFDPESWHRSSYYFWKKHLAEVGGRLARSIPEGSCFILVDDDQWGQGGLAPRREAMPFLEKDGQYWGPPPDDSIAISELERMRSRGANFLVVAEPCFWWFDHFASFFKFLRSTYRCIAEDGEFVVFDLRSATS